MRGRYFFKHQIGETRKWLFCSNFLHSDEKSYPRILFRIPDSAAEVPDIVITALKQQVGNLRKQEYSFNPGDHIKVFTGPFDGYEGILDMILNGTERVRILIELVRGRALNVELPEKSLKKIV